MWDLRQKIHNSEFNLVVSIGTKFCDIWLLYNTNSFKKYTVLKKIVLSKIILIFLSKLMV